MTEQARKVVDAIKEAFDIFEKMELPTEERKYTLGYDSVMALINGFQQLEAAQPKWISVEERLPEIENENGTAKCTETVLGVDKLGYQYVGYFRIYKYDSSLEFVGCDCDAFDRGEFDVTHWMPLPEPPKED